MYDGEHSITFYLPNFSVGKNTWDDWFLIPTSRPTMTTPGPQTKYIEVQGVNGSYDNSDYLTPTMKYGDRTGTFEFIVDNDHADWLTIYQAVAIFIHGQKLRMVLSDDPGYYWEGRFTLDDFKSDKTNSKITIGYRVSPNKSAVPT